MHPPKFACKGNFSGVLLQHRMLYLASYLPAVFEDEPSAHTAGRNSCPARLLQVLLLSVEACQAVQRLSDMGLLSRHMW